MNKRFNFHLILQCISASECHGLYDLTFHFHRAYPLCNHILGKALVTITSRMHLLNIPWHKQCKLFPVSRPTFRVRSSKLETVPHTGPSQIQTIPGPTRHSPLCSPVPNSNANTKELRARACPWCTDHVSLGTVSQAAFKFFQSHDRKLYKVPVQ